MMFPIALIAVMACLAGITADPKPNPEPNPEPEPKDIHIHLYGIGKYYCTHNIKTYYLLTLAILKF